MRVTINYEPRPSAGYEDQLTTPRTHAEHLARHRLDYPGCDCPHCVDLRDADECRQTETDNARTRKD